MNSRISYPKLSKISQSKTQILKEDFEKYLKEITEVKYPVRAFDKAVSIAQKLKSLKIQSVRKQLKTQLEEFGLNSYRKVRGDGNCFFRAIAFQFLSNISKPSVKLCFPLLDEISLTCCYPQSIPKEFQKFYDGQFLENILYKYWENTIRDLQKGNKIQRKTLLTIFDRYPFLDFIMILYFRAVCLRALQLYHNSQIKEYLCGTEQQTIRTYKQQSQGVILNLCSKILKIKIIVFEIRPKQIMKYRYNCDQQPISEIYLMFQDSHYDVFEKNQEIQSEKSVLKSQQYYAEVNEKKIAGTCIECNAKSTIFEENNLCLDCYNSSLSNLADITSKNDELIRAKCTQCLYTRNQVSKLYGLCIDCMQMQKKNMNASSKYEKKQSIQSNSSTSSSYLHGKCQVCKFRDLINSETGLCKDCERNQKKIENEFYKEKQEEIMRQSRRGMIISNHTQQCKGCKKMKVINKSKTKYCNDCLDKSSLSQNSEKPYDLWKRGTFGK